MGGTFAGEEGVVRVERGGRYIVTRSRVHFAACIDRVVFFLALNVAELCVIFIRLSRLLVGIEMFL